MSAYEKLEITIVNEISKIIDKKIIYDLYVKPKNKHLYEKHKRHKQIEKYHRMKNKRTTKQQRRDWIEYERSMDGY